MQRLNVRGGVKFANFYTYILQKMSHCSFIVIRNSHAQNQKSVSHLHLTKRSEKSGQGNSTIVWLGKQDICKSLSLPSITMFHRLFIVIRNPHAQNKTNGKSFPLGHLRCNHKKMQQLRRAEHLQIFKLTFCQDFPSFVHSNPKFTCPKQKNRETSSLGAFVDAY